MTDYRIRPSTDPTRPDFLVGEDIVSNTQMAALLVAAEKEESGELPPGTSSQVLEQIKAKQIQ